MQEYISKPREYKYRNVDFGLITRHYRLPMAGQVSILHRVSGMLLFLGLPLMVHLFSLSLNQFSFVLVSKGAWGFVIGLACLVGIWGYFHHLFAGIRFLLLDLHIGLDKNVAQKTAFAVVVLSLTMLVAFAIKFYMYWGGY